MMISRQQPEGKNSGLDISRSVSVVVFGGLYMGIRLLD
jgi:hypothetical protein